MSQITWTKTVVELISILEGYQIGDDAISIIPEKSEKPPGICLLVIYQSPAGDHITDATEAFENAAETLRGGLDMRVELSLEKIFTSDQPEPFGEMEGPNAVQIELGLFLTDADSVQTLLTDVGAVLSEVETRTVFTVK